MADKKKKSSKKKAPEKSRGGMGFFILAVFVLLLLFVAEVALLAPPDWIPEPVHGYVVQAQETVPLPFPEARDPEARIADLRAEHEETLDEIKRKAEAEIEKIKQQAEDLRAENKRLRNSG